MPPSPGEVPSAAKKSPSELAGKYEMIKDTAGNDKRGLCMAVYPCGFFLVSACALCSHSRESISSLFAASHSQPLCRIRANFSRSALSAALRTKNRWTNVAAHA